MTPYKFLSTKIESPAGRGPWGN